MRRLKTLVFLCCTLSALAALAATPPPDNAAGAPERGVSGVSRVHYGGAVSTAKAIGDTLYLMGGPLRLDGKFQDATRTVPDRQGWTSIDQTLKTTVRWNPSTFNAELLDAAHVPNTAIWCGALFTSCGPGDPPEGYGNNWDEYFDWTGTVADKTQPTLVNITARLNYDCETDYDYLFLEVERATGMDILLSYTGANRTGSPSVVVPVNVNETFSVGTEDYVGPAHDQVHLRWHATADGGYSDQDCNWAGSGHSQVDNIAVRFDGVLKAFDDFEPGSPIHWVVAFPVSSGDFSKVWPRLSDIDPCGGNATPVFAFVDDGVVVPGTGGTLGTTWTYGPSGYVVNLLGGLAGPDFHIDNEIWSPAIDWPAGYDGGQLLFDVYQHLPLSNGMFWQWKIRSSADGGATWTGWRNDNLVYYDDAADYSRVNVTLTSYLATGRDKAQICFTAIEAGWVWGFNGTDATPAPYFDNVALLAFRFTGPGMTVRDIDTFNDNFPGIGVIDYANLGSNSVRVDIAKNISPSLHLRNDPGDSMFVDIAPARTGSVLNGRPEMLVQMRTNPLFDAYRLPLASLPGTWTRSGRILSGAVPGDTTYTRPAGTVVANRWNWDLPDTGFFYPGDVIHLCVKAQDNLGGDIGTSFLPADTTGFSLFPGMTGYVSLRYDNDFVVNALPTLFSGTAGDQPHILLWNDFGNRGGENEWIGSLDRLGYRLGQDYDVYYTKAPTSGLGNGLGGRSSAPQLAGYQTMLYTSGDQASATMSNGDFEVDPGDDISVVDEWLNSGGKNLFATGDGLEEDLNGSGTEAVTFRNKWLSVAHVGNDLRPLIGNQTAPRVSPIAGNPLGLTQTWVADGGCVGGLNQFDAVTPIGTAVRVAEFLSPSGATGAYPYAAGVYNNVTASTARVVYLPYDFMYLANTGSATTGLLSTRAQVLRTLLLYFGEAPGGPAVGLPSAGVLSVRNYPNPFNPSTKIEFNLPRAGRVELKIYNVRGELVRTLLDQHAEAGVNTVVWNGTDATGRTAASGVYFYSLKTADGQKFEKITLVK